MTKSSESNPGPSTEKQAARDRKGKEPLKVKVEDDDQKQVMKSI